MRRSCKAPPRRLVPFLTSALFLLASTLWTPAGQAWGPKGHQWISEKGIECLDGPLRQLLSRQRATIVERCLDPDFRKEKDPEEGFRHYIDLDHYGAYPFPKFDLNYEKLVQRFGRQAVHKNGVALWAGRKPFEDLVEAFRRQDQEKIILYASDLSHYVGDLHQPFHTVVNYNGQLTGQRGIHFRFEDDLLNIYLDRIRFTPASPSHLGPVLEALYAVALDSFVWVDNILVADQKAVTALDIDRSQYISTRENRKLYPEAYYARMFEELKPLLERRLNAAAHSLASLWWMAWKQAGEPH